MSDKSHSLNLLLSRGWSERETKILPRKEFFNFRFFFIFFNKMHKESLFLKFVNFTRQQKKYFKHFTIQAHNIHAQHTYFSWNISTNADATGIKKINGFDDSSSLRAANIYIRFGNIDAECSLFHFSFLIFFLYLCEKKYWQNILAFLLKFVLYWRREHLVLSLYRVSLMKKIIF